MVYMYSSVQYTKYGIQARGNGCCPWRTIQILTSRIDAVSALYYEVQLSSICTCTSIFLPLVRIPTLPRLLFSVLIKHFARGKQSQVGPFSKTAFDTDHTYTTL